MLSALGETGAALAGDPVPADGGNGFFRGFFQVIAGLRMREEPLGTRACSTR